jgi:hypothetical protein
MIRQEVGVVGIDIKNREAIYDHELRPMDLTDLRLGVLARVDGEIGDEAWIFGYLDSRESKALLKINGLL